MVHNYSVQIISNIQKEGRENEIKANSKVLDMLITIAYSLALCKGQRSIKI